MAKVVVINLFASFYVFFFNIGSWLLFCMVSYIYIIYIWVMGIVISTFAIAIVEKAITTERKEAKS